LRPWLIGIATIGLITGISACNYPGFSWPKEGMASTIKATEGTIQQLETQVALAFTPTPEPRFYLPIPPTVTLSPEMAGLTVPINDNVPCNRAAFISDVTIPDGVEIPPGSIFTKIWEIQNNGSCTWDNTYSVAFTGEGSSLSADIPAPILADEKVEPGEIVRISYELTAPDQFGPYYSEWKLLNGNGDLFGIGEDGDEAFWLEIEVADRYSFADNLCSASWQNSTNVLTCPMAKNSEQGYAIPATPSEIETLENQAGKTLLLVPEGVTGGVITGVYEAILVPEMAHFQTKIGCLEEGSPCSAVFALGYRLVDGYEVVLGTWPVTNEGKITSIDLDLAPFSLPGSQVEFILSVTSQRDSGGDLVYLSDPQIFATP